MVTPMIVIADEVIDLCLQNARQIVLFKQNAFLEGLMLTLDLALGHRVVRRAADVLHALVFHPLGEITSDVISAIVG